MLVVVEVEVALLLVVLEVLVAAAQELLQVAALVGRVLQIQAVAAAVRVITMVVLVVPALSSCPTPCQKAQSLNSCLLRHGKHQQESLPLTTW